MLQEFITNESAGEVPLEGSIPDMTSSTELVLILLKLHVLCILLVITVEVKFSSRHYVNLQKVYQAKAEADVSAMERRVHNILKKIGRDPSSISKSTVKMFCKNARKLTVSIQTYLDLLCAL